MRKRLFLFGIVLLCAIPADAETWVKIKSPHFTVISNGSEKDAREVAAGFEQIHAVFEFGLPGLRTDSGAETIVIATKDEKSFVDLVPSQKKEARNLAGEFHKGWEKDFVIVRLDFPDENRNIVYHEYVHKLLHLNFTRMPLWLDEGLAEFFGNTLTRKDGIFVGAPSPRLSLLRAKTIYPLQTILSVNQGSPYYRDEDKAGMFYAESWVLTHFLILGPNMGNGQRMNAYLRAIQKQADSQKVFQETFGNLDEVQKPFSQYIQRFSFNALHLDKLQNVEPSTFVSGAMSPAERDTRLGTLYTYTREKDAANRRLTAALREDPRLSLAHENAAFLYFDDGKDEDAKNEFDQAVALDPRDYLALYYQAMMQYHGKADADSLAKLDAALSKVLELNPRYAPPLVVRSQILVRQGKLQDAFNAAAQAVKLEPDRAGYQTNAAEILVLGHNYPEAIKVADAVAARWSATDSAEALAVADQARRLGKIETTADEKTQREDEMKYAHDSKAVEGVVKSVTCEELKPMEIVLQNGDKILNFSSQKAYGMGFSDTLWYGADHFNPCHHLEGMNAVVRYRPPSDPTGENEMRWLEIRDELIPTSIDTGR
jgi:tetratricopeptide (TPR) repeat protein